MKKILLSSSLCWASIAAFGQITVTKNDLVKVGQTVIQSSTNGTFALPAAGPNQTWNFSSLTADSKDTITFGLNSWFTGYTNFPGATHGIDNGDSSWSFMKINDNEFTIIGSYDIYNGIGSASEFNFKVLALPTTFNKVDKDSSFQIGEPSEFGLDPDGMGPLPVIDSVQVNYASYSNIKMDAWGKLTTPLGTYDVLRSNNEMINRIKLKLKANNIWIDAPQAVVDMIMGSGGNDTSYQHFFFTNQANIGFPLMTYSLTSAQDSITDISWISSSPTFSSTSNVHASEIQMYPNPVANILTIQAKDKTLSVTLFSQDGRMVKVAGGYESIRMDLNELPMGTYWVKIKDQYGNIENRSIIKN